MTEDREMTPQQLLRDHIETGEPLTEEELNAVVAAGLTDRSVWEDRGGGLYWHQGAHSIDPQ